MWQAPNQRVRALQIAKKRQMDRLKRPIHIKRAQGQLKTVKGTSEIHDVRILLNDMNAKGMGIFAHKALLVGEEVSITLEEPSPITVKGKIVWCQEHDVSSHVISKAPFSYRMGMAFVFQTQEEEEAVQQFCEKLAKEHLFATQVA